MDENDGLNIEFKSQVSQDGACGETISIIKLKLTKSDVEGVETDTIYLPDIFKFDQFKSKLYLAMSTNQTLNAKWIGNYEFNAYY